MTFSYSILRNLIRETVSSLNEKKQHEYGSVGHINELDNLIDELMNLKHSLRKGPSRLKYRKEMHRLQDAIGAIRYLKNVARREGIKKGLLSEGGLKAPGLTGSVNLDPSTVSDAIKSYSSAIEMWNAHLSSKNLDPVTLIGPVGSSAYYGSDPPETSYGDVDYLVSFPIQTDDTMSQDDIRARENEVKRQYEGELRTFLNQSHDVERYVNTEASNRGSPYLLIVKLPDGRHVQVDTIITFPTYSQPSGEQSDSQWMPARWTPERGLKGYTIGNLYTALGNYFNMSIGDRGVTAKMRSGERVPSRMRKGTKLSSISKNIRTFLIDIARELGGDDIVENELLLRYPGMNPENIKIKDLAAGIAGLALTLADNKIINSHDKMLRDILDLYESGLRKNVDSKLSMGLSSEKYDNLLKLNQRVLDIVRSTFDQEAT